MGMVKKILLAPERFIQFLTKTNPNGEITKLQKFLLAFPSMPGTLSSVLIHNAFIKYYTDMIGLDPKYVGVIYLIFGIWNAINDPAIGVLLDRYEYTEKKGKFVYFMKITAPITVFSAFAMVFAQPSWDQWLIFAFLLVLLFIYDTTQTTYTIAHASYVLVSAASSKERVDVSVIQSYVSNIGGLLGTLIPTLLLVGESNHRLTVILFSVVLGVNAILYFLAVKPLKEAKEMYVRENENIKKGEGLFTDITTNAKDAFKSRAFITYILFQLISQSPKKFYFTPFLYVMDYVLRTGGIEATMVDIIPGVVLFLFAPFIGKFLKRFGTKKAAMLASLPSAFGFLLIYFISNLWTALIAYVIMYFFSSAASIANAPMLGAVIDEDEQRTGSRNAGLYNGLNALLTIPANGIQASIFLWVIGSFGFVSGSEVQSASALLGIRIGAGIIPFVMTLIGIIPLFFYPINKKRELELSDFSKQARGNKSTEK